MARPQPRIALCSLRQGLWWWPQPLACIQDAFFLMLQKWFEDRHIYPRFYNVSWGDKRPKRDIEALEWANIIFLFSSNEFTYHGSDVVNPLFLKEMNKKIEQAKHAFDGKRVILFSIELRDPPELIQKVTLEGTTPREWHTIHNHEFPLTLGSIRFDLLSELRIESPKLLDFVYWGTIKRQLPGGEKSGDARYDIIRKVLKEASVRSYLSGNHFGSSKADQKWESSMAKLAPKLAEAYTTCCFQWPGFGHVLTWRYQEALALGIIPLVHKDFDTDRIVAKEEWLRIGSADELALRATVCRKDPGFADRTYKQVRKDYMRIAPSVEDQYNLMAKRLKDFGL